MHPALSSVFTPEWGQAKGALETLHRPAEPFWHKAGWNLIGRETSQSETSTDDS